MKVVKVIGPAAPPSVGGVFSTPYDGRFVVSWNPHTEAGILELTSTASPERARRFASLEEVMEEWRTISRVQPKRPRDGKPNRPLTGVHIEIINAPEED